VRGPIDGRWDEGVGCISIGVFPEDALRTKRYEEKKTEDEGSDVPPPPHCLIPTISHGGGGGD